MTLIILIKNVKLEISSKCCHAECCKQTLCAECHYADCRCAECRYAERRYAYCRCTDCHGAVLLRHINDKSASTCHPANIIVMQYFVIAIKLFFFFILNDRSK
jgi:hypothetical protein